mgnify:CR=1 FL=1
MTTKIADQLLPSGVARTLPDLYSQDEVKDPIVWVKFFNPYGAGTWLITEYDGNDTMFGYAQIHQGGGELGYVSLRELRSIKKFGGPGIERDVHFKPKPLSQAKRENRIGSDAPKEATMNDTNLRKALIRTAATMPKGAGRTAILDLLKEAKFEEGVPADPTVNMTEEQKAEWKRQNELHKDKFKTARTFRPVRTPEQADGDRLASDTNLRKALIRTAAAMPKGPDRTAVLELVAGCEKLPNDAMVKNCEDKKKEGDKKDK